MNQARRAPNGSETSLLALLTLCALSCAGSDVNPAGSAPRNPSWAVPMSLPGLPNLHKVTDTLYRGAQPEPEGLRELKKLGIKTVVNLREHHDDEDELERVGLTSADLRLVSIPIDTGKLNLDQMTRFLRIATDPSAQPVFVHCLHGADRTGTATAVYRIVVQGWTKQQAIEELRHGGYGFHEVWKNLPEFLENLDVEELRNRIEQASVPRESAEEGS